MYDSKSIFEDQLSHVQTVSDRKGEKEINLAFLTDGLKAEREQGITIDVAYRYFATPRRKFIIADTPGHIQYTRNMVTGASTANVALILVDARKGIVEQTRRHAFIASLLQIPHILFCVNKMDLVDYDQAVFEELRDQLEAFSSKLQVEDVNFIPISALRGDNIVNRSESMDWYEGPTLMYYLENVHISSDHNFTDVRFPVQLVIRPNTDEHHDFRGYAGRVAGGVIKVGDEVSLLPSGFVNRVKGIFVGGTAVEEAYPPMSVIITLEEEMDLSRGDMIVRPQNQPRVDQDLDIMLCWFDHRQALTERSKYVIRHTSREARCMVKNIQYKLDINTLHRNMEDRHIGMNDIARVQLRVTQPLFTDPYSRNRQTGSVILVVDFSNNTVAAGMVI